MFNLDLILFRFFNNLSVLWPPLGVVAVFCASVLIWLLFAWYVWSLMWRKRGGGHEMFAVILGGAMAYLFNAAVSLWWFRPRPFAALSNVHQLIYHSTASKSFPSDHATLAFFLATLLAIHRPQWRWRAYSVAAFIALGRVVVGVHYPSDILAGAIVGTVFGLLTREIELFFHPEERLRRLRKWGLKRT